MEKQLVSSSYLDTNWSNQLKGIAMIMVVIGHLQIVSHMAAWGLGIFLIVTGFGLTRSYLKNGLNNFFIKKINKIFVPYFFVTIIWVIIDALLKIQHSFPTTIMALLGLNFTENIDKSMWYITFLLIWYIVFYFVFKFIKGNSIKVIVLFATSVMLAILDVKKTIFPVPVAMPLYCVEFPIGVFIGLLYSKIIKINLRRLKLIHLIICAVSFLFFLLIWQSPTFKYEYYFEVLFFSVAGICIFGLLSIYSIRIKAFEFIGRISLEIFLFEYVFIYNYRFFFNLQINIWLERLFYFIFILCLSILLNILTSAVFKKLKIRANNANNS